MPLCWQLGMGHAQSASTRGLSTKIVECCPAADIEVTDFVQSFSHAALDCKSADDECEQPLQVRRIESEEDHEDDTHGVYFEEETEDEVAELAVYDIGGQELCRLRACLGKHGWSVPELRAAVQAAAAVPIFQQRLLVGDTELPFTCTGPSLHTALPPGCTELTLVRLSEEQGEWMESIARKGVHVFHGAPLEVRSDPALALLAIRFSPLAISSVPLELLQDHEWMMNMLTESPEAVAHAPGWMKTTPEYLFACSKARSMGKIGKRSDNRFGRLPRRWE